MFKHAICLTAVLFTVTVNAEIITRNYDGFTLWIDCNEKAAIQYQYQSRLDTGNAKRHKKFYLAPDVPKRCQQHSTTYYRAPHITYDRGHLVPANHMDYSKLAIKQSNYMVNVWPQTKQLNRKAMLRTEEIIECYRDYQPINVIGGVIVGNNPRDDYFIRSHGIKTPDAFWKIIYNKKSALAWIFPNSKSPTKKNLDRYLVTIQAIERQLGRKLPVPKQFKKLKPNRSWPLPKNCKLG